jgi:hypothetical protein
MGDEYFVQPEFLRHPAPPVASQALDDPVVRASEDDNNHHHDDDIKPTSNYYDIPSAPLADIHDPHKRRVETFGHVVKSHARTTSSVAKPKSASETDKKEVKRTEHLHGLQEKSCKCANRCLYAPLTTLRFISDQFVGKKEEVNEKICKYFSQAEVSTKSENSHQFNHKTYEFKFVYEHKV